MTEQEQTVEGFAAYLKEGYRWFRTPGLDLVSICPTCGTIVSDQARPNHIQFHIALWLSIEQAQADV